ncbi:MAG TPA: polysaccharide biosynthesis/export family protein [Gemmatimonadaceae bacterium]|nr:polysaccharide biosynthesis/export family protein [Gemmatimonadaceae bacterium]
MLVALAGVAPLRAQDVTDEAVRRAASAQLRPGDRIELQFRRDRELNSSIAVDERGEAVFPKLGVLDVAELTIAGLQDTLRSRYAEYLRHPELEVTVLRRIVVNGEVRAPNVYMLDVASSGVRDAIARAGGLLETSNKSKVYVVRDGQRVHVRSWENSRGPETDLQSGDQIIVGRKSWLTLNALPVISTSVIVIGLIRSMNNN